jgi:HlyD family secretion protein
MTAGVTRGRVEMVVNSSGTVKPKRMVSVGAFASGPIMAVKVDFNSPVRGPAKDAIKVVAGVALRHLLEGTILAEIDERLLKAARDRDTAYLATQQAELNRVEALLQQAANNETRARRLLAVNRDYISDNEMDQILFARAALEAQRGLAQAAIRQAEATLKKSQQDLDYAIIIAPVDGIIIERKIDPGQTVVASFQTPELFTIAPEIEHVFASVDEADIGLIEATRKRGAKAKFTVDAFANEIFDATIVEIRNNSTTTQNVVTYPVLIRASDPERKLRPGMTANITFPIEAKENVLRVPAVALRFRPVKDQVRPEDQHYVEPVVQPNEPGTRRSAGEKAMAARNRSNRIVWVQEERLLRAVPITIGLMESHYAEVLSGELKEGDRVITGVETAAR